MFLIVKHWKQPKCPVFEWKVKPVATYQGRGSFYCHHKKKDVECEDSGQHEPRLDAKADQQKGCMQWPQLHKNMHVETAWHQNVSLDSKE